MRRLFTSKDRSKVELVRKELFRAGIRCEVRSNAVAQPLLDLPALVELWINHDGDFLRASKLFADLQSAKDGGSAEGEGEEHSGGAAGAKTNGTCAAATQEEVTPNEAREAPPVGAAIESEENALTEAEEAAAELLSAQAGIHQQLRDLRDKCAAMEVRLRKSAEALGKSQEQLDRETARRRTLEQQAAEVLDMRTALEQERAQRTKAVQQLQGELESKANALQAAEGAVAELKKVRIELTKKLESVGERERVLLKRIDPLEAELKARVAKVQTLESSLQAETVERQRVQTHLEASEARLRALANQLKAIASSHLQPLKPKEKEEASRVALKI